MHYETILRVVVFALVIVAARLAYVWKRPFRDCSKCSGRGCRKCNAGQVPRRGGRWANRVHLSALQSRDERRRP